MGWNWITGFWQKPYTWLDAGGDDFLQRANSRDKKKLRQRQKKLREKAEKAEKTADNGQLAEEVVNVEEEVKWSLEVNDI